MTVLSPVVGVDGVDGVEGGEAFVGLYPRSVFTDPKTVDPLIKVELAKVTPASPIANFLAPSPP